MRKNVHASRLNANGSIRGGRLFQIFLTGGPKIKEKVNKAIKEKVRYMNIAIEKTVKKTCTFVIIQW